MAIQGVGSAAQGPAESRWSRLPPFGRDGDFGGELQWQDNQRVAPIGLDDEQVAGLQPRVQLAESVLAAFALNSAINTKDGNCQVAGIPAAYRAGQRHSLGAEAGVLQQAHDRTLEAVAFLARCAAAAFFACVLAWGGLLA
jgi:hypothetical protein